MAQHCCRSKVQQPADPGACDTCAGFCRWICSCAFERLPDFGVQCAIVWRPEGGEGGGGGQGGVDSAKASAWPRVGSRDTSSVKNLTLVHCTRLTNVSPPREPNLGKGFCQGIPRHRGFPTRAAIGTESFSTPATTQNHCFWASQQRSAAYCGGSWLSVPLCALHVLDEISAGQQSAAAEMPERTCPESGIHEFGTTSKWFTSVSGCQYGNGGGFIDLLMWRPAPVQVGN